MFKKIILFLIQVYRLFLSPVKMWCQFCPSFYPSCRFSPSCSDYAKEAIDYYGIIKGGKMAIKRLLKCHPWHPGGYDPVK